MNRVYDFVADQAVGFFTLTWPEGLVMALGLLGCIITPLLGLALSLTLFGLLRVLRRLSHNRREHLELRLRRFLKSRPRLCDRDLSWQPFSPGEPR